MAVKPFPVIASVYNDALLTFFSQFEKDNKVPYLFAEVWAKTPAKLRKRGRRKIERAFKHFKRGEGIKKPRFTADSISHFDFASSFSNYHRLLENMSTLTFSPTVDDVSTGICTSYVIESRLCVNEGQYQFLLSIGLLNALRSYGLKHTRAINLVQSPLSLFYIQYKAGQSSIIQHTDETEQLTQILCLQQHDSDKACFYRVDAEGHETDVVFETGTGINMSKYVVHGVRSPQHGQRIVLVVFW
jgi:hypothetical protein